MGIGLARFRFGGAEFSTISLASAIRFRSVGPTEVGSRA